MYGSSGLSSTGIFWLRNNGDNTFEFVLISDENGASRWITTGDLDNDGDPDLIVAADQVVWCELVQPGEFIVRTIDATIPNPQRVLTLDLDGDNDLDVLALGSETGFRWYSSDIFQAPQMVPGDANADGTTNILDITTIVAYLMGNNPHPFLRAAADVNHDDAINVLDIVGVVNIILHGRAIPAIPAENGTLQLTSTEINLELDGCAAGLQLKVKAENPEAITVHPFEGMQSAVNRSEDNVLLLVYSAEGSLISSGEHPVLSWEEEMDVQVEEIIVSDPVGNPVAIILEDVNKIDETASLPSAFCLYANYPNPFNPATTIAYDLPEPCDVRLAIYDLLGREVMNRQFAGQPAGQHSIVWDGRSTDGLVVSSGAYFVRLEAGKYSATRKIVLMK